MKRKVVAVVAVAIEFAIVAGVVIPALRLQHQGALVQLCVMVPYLVLLKTTWSGIVRKQQSPDVAKNGSDTGAMIERIGRAVHSRPLIIIVAAVVAVVVVCLPFHRYRVLTTDKTLFRFDRYTGRCERLVNGMTPHFVPVLEHDEMMRKRPEPKVKRESKPQNTDFDLSEYLNQK